MGQENIEVYLRLRAAQAKEIESLQWRVMNSERPADAVKLLRRLADSESDSQLPTANAIGYLGCMCRALDEHEFRLIGLEPSCEEATCTRRKRSAAYKRYRALFEMETAFGRKQKACAIPLVSDWSGIGMYLKESAQLMRSKIMLRAAGWLYKARMPGAKDLCEAAAYIMFKVTYEPTKNARAVASL